MAFQGILDLELTNLVPLPRNEHMELNIWYKGQISQQLLHGRRHCKGDSNITLGWKHGRMCLEMHHTSNWGRIGVSWASPQMNGFCCHEWGICLPWECISGSWAEKSSGESAETDLWPSSHNILLGGSSRFHVSTVPRIKLRCLPVKYRK